MCDFQPTETHAETQHRPVMASQFDSDTETLKTGPHKSGLFYAIAQVAVLQGVKAKKKNFNFLLILG